MVWRDRWNLQLGAVSLFRSDSESLVRLLAPVPLIKVTLNLFGVLVPLLLPFQDVLAGLEKLFFSASESDVRDCGLWFGGTGETFSWVLFPCSRAFPKVHNKASQDLHWPASASHIEPVWRVGATSFAFPGRACWARNFIFLQFRKWRFGGTGETFSWVLVSCFGTFPTVHNKASQDFHLPASANSFG